MLRRFTLVVEDHPDQPLATAADLERAVFMMADPEGPTYVMLKERIARSMALPQRSSGR